MHTPSPGHGGQPPAVTVVTVQRGRLDHLRCLVRAVEADATRRRHHQELVVVNMGGPSPEIVLPVGSLHLDVHVERMGEPGDEGLPLAAARNRGLAAATHDVVLFCDVDVVPLAGTIAAVATHTTEHPGAVVLGDVLHLPRDVAGDAPPGQRAAAAERPGAQSSPPPRGFAREPDHRLFWSTLFAARREVLADVGGFDEGYVGYGAEDTDLGLRLERAGVELHRVAGVVGHHQWHPSPSPPVQHLVSIVRNATRFRRLWGRWPMEGWLAAFAEQGLVDWQPDGDHLALRVDATGADELEQALRPAGAT